MGIQAKRTIAAIVAAFAPTLFAGYIGWDFAVWDWEPFIRALTIVSGIWLAVMVAMFPGWEE